MGSDELHEYKECMLKEISGWEDVLIKATEAVSLVHLIVIYRGTYHDRQQNKSILVVHSHPFFPVLPDKMLEYIQLLASPKPCHLRSENFSLVPDSLLLRPGTIPLISIRDPRLCVPSTYRVLERMNLPRGGSRSFMLVATCNVWNCVLYNFYKSHGIEPVVVDADDYMTSEAFVRNLHVRLGLDPTKVRFKWDAVTEEQKEREIHPMLFASQNTLFESEGVIAGRAAKNSDFDGLEEKWREEFGEDAGLIGEMVGFAEPHYRYLYERRWKVGEAGE
jgi:hypothetical protein